jgi:uncharacterized LabA/DUF88 family protein
MQNTAIFYDIENLIKGYNQSQIVANNISLRDILAKIRQAHLISEIGIQRAYANWSDHRLTVMAKEISELGIEPIQIFGLSRNQKKNAADIQLAVDAIDLAYIRPWFDVFVIVSGDGGFSALGKKLHECGRKVIGCAYKSATNQIFESVCDIFIHLEEPNYKKVSEDKNIFEKKVYSKSNITHPLAIKLSGKINHLSSEDKNEIIEQSKKIISIIANDSECVKQLNTNGINMGVAREVFKHAIKDFNISILGFSKFVDFFNFIAQGSSLVTILMPNNEMKIVFCDNNLTHNILLKNSDELLFNLKITNQTVKRMANDLERLSSENNSEIIEHSKNIINWFENDQESKKIIQKQGISLSVVKEAFKYGIENFEPLMVGFGRFIEFLQYITANTNFVISKSPNNTSAITYRNSHLDNLEILPYLDESYIHSPDNYSAILGVNSPIFRVINSLEQYNLISIIFKLEGAGRNRESLCNYLNQQAIEYEMKTVNACISNLIGAKIIEDQENLANLSDVNFQINPNFTHVDSAVEQIFDCMRRKLVDFFDEDFQENVFTSLLDS